jgi:hypothetical protein
LMVTGRVADDDAVPKAINSACDRRDINCKHVPSVTAHTRMHHATVSCEARPGHCARRHSNHKGILAHNAGVDARQEHKHVESEAEHHRRWCSPHKPSLATNPWHQ